MSSLTNINNNSSVINVGRTTPISPGAQPAARSIPVVVASDQQPIPVVEQQKIQSEVALSMLGIPRSEVALGIFSDVNTYDVNPVEWAELPEEYTPGWGIRHLPQEAGAIVQAPKDKIAVLTSKRFFRYQPGRVSAATFGVKSSKSPKPDLESDEYDLNPSIRKYGIFDKFDGYYWESRGDLQGDNFAVVRRTQSLLNYNPVEFFNTTTNQDDYRIVGKPAADPSAEPNLQPRAIEIVRDKIFEIIDEAYDNAVASFTPGSASHTHLTQTSGATGNHVEKCKRDAFFAINAYLLDLQYGGRGHTIVNATTYRTAIGPTSGDPDINAAETKLHEELRDSMIARLTGLGVDGIIDPLATITINAVNGDQPSEPDRFGTGGSASFWPRNRFSTIFSIYKRYLGYLISEAFIPAAGGSQDYTDEDFKYKCLRDVGYIVDGYGRDLAGGGNAATVYNMKNFYFNNVLQVVSTFANGYTATQFHIDAHTILKALISKEGPITSGDNPNSDRWTIQGLIDVDFESVLDYFGLQNSRSRFNNELADPLIANFDNATKYQGQMSFGTQAQFGDLITLRDGLIHVHAAVYDPSLLKETRKVRVRVNDSDDTLEVAEGEFVVDQMINFIGDAGGLTSDKFYAVKEVKGPLSNVITLYDPTDDTKTKIPITSPGSDNFIEPNVPFVFPDIYQKGSGVTGTGTPVGGPWRKYDGMFPYMYLTDPEQPNPFDNVDEDGNTKFTSLPTDGNIDNLVAVGFINTAIDTSTSAFEILRQQIDAVNFKYNNWIKQNVDPRYYAVYEYRLPRSYFSTDKLDGETRDVVYSDVAIGETELGAGRVVRPGQSVQIDNALIQSTSLWDIDLTKVTMLKVEFSWYGAVGALFLAYVPVGNGEARWVRVHHLRASNQLKISSLGNATLPITYLTYGGGSPNKLGIEIPSGFDNGYGSSSDHIVKYGASYYIDGGDRGTVRLYSHTNLLPTQVFGKTIPLNIVGSGSDDIGFYIEVSAGTVPADRTFFMKGQIVTSSIQDQNVEVVWVSGNRLYLNTSQLNSTDGIKIISKRPAITFGLKAKESIFNSEGTGVRNRVQVYPTQLSTANFGTTPVSLDILKTPIFQTVTPTSGSLELEQGLSEDEYTITAENRGKLAVTSASENYLDNDGDETYGWFRSNLGTVFGRVYREAGEYYFDLKDVFTQPVRLFNGPNFPFLKDGRFDASGNSITGAFEAVSQKERLSSVFISNVIQAPIPDTGTKITSFFLSPGADQFDLLTYFDYNKDYLSFPLTDEVESIYLTGTLSGEITEVSEMNTSITWEEQ